MAVTRLEVINHVREHFGLSVAETATLLRMPEHPRELRDEFAIAALSGMLAQPGFTLDIDGDRIGQKRAELAYSLADTMLEARNENR